MCRHVKSPWHLARDRASTRFAQSRPGEEDHQPEVGSLRLLVFQRMKGQTGLFFTSYAPDETEAWFEDFKAPDYARAGNIADRDVVLPIGEHGE